MTAQAWPTEDDLRQADERGDRGRYDRANIDDQDRSQRLAAMRQAELDVYVTAAREAGRWRGGPLALAAVYARDPSLQAYRAGGWPHRSPAEWAALDAQTARRKLDGPS